VDRRVPIDPGGPLENRSIEGRPVREGYRGFRVTTDSETEFRQEGQPIDFDSLGTGDRVAVLGEIVGEEITAYRIDRSAPPAEQAN
jgi:hypothetical protein